MKTNIRKHLSRIAEMPCSLCGASAPSLIHHLREGQGMAQRADDYLTVPLCPDCHQGPNGVHGDKALLKVYKIDELGLLAKTIEQISQD